MAALGTIMRRFDSIYVFNSVIDFETLCTFIVNLKDRV